VRGREEVPPAEKFRRHRAMIESIPDFACALSGLPIAVRRVPWREAKGAFEAAREPLA